MCQVEPLDLSLEKGLDYPDIVDDVGSHYLRKKVEAMAKDMTQFSYSELWRECCRRYNDILRKLLGMEVHSNVITSREEYFNASREMEGFHCTKRKLEDKTNNEYLPLKKRYLRKDIDPSKPVLHESEMNIVIGPTPDHEEYCPHLPYYHEANCRLYRMDNITLSRKSASDLTNQRISNLVKYDNNENHVCEGESQVVTLPNLKKFEVPQCGLFPTKRWYPTETYSETVSPRVSVPLTTPDSRLKINTPYSNASSVSKAFHPHSYLRYEHDKSVEQAQLYSKRVPFKQQRTVRPSCSTNSKSFQDCIKMQQKSAKFECKEVVSDIYANPFIKNFNFRSKSVINKNEKVNTGSKKSPDKNSKTREQVRGISNGCAEKGILSTNIQTKQRDVRENQRDRILRNLLGYDPNDDSELGRTKTLSSSTNEKQLPANTKTNSNLKDSNSFLTIIESACDKMANAGTT